eukprot:jgi/Chrpa1/15426/Chrysochromulina_OHIO_Genome00003513-RA
MAHNHNHINSANKAALAMKDETIAHLIQLLSDKQAEYKTALAKKDETIERLIQLLSDKQLHDAPAVSYPFAKPAAPAAAPSTSPFVQGSHPGVSCDRSGMMPIVGMRYHLRGYDYDLCQAEYDKLSEFEKCQYEAMAPH